MDEDLVGQKLGRYRIVRELGSGGMGVVYEAMDDERGLRVALKVLAEDLAEDEENLERFRREGMMASRISHPNVIKVYDVGQQGPHNYIAMEFIEGGELQSLIQKKGRLDVPEALKIAEQIAEALSAAHAIEILHRDVKPHNIMIDKDGRVKVVDFGIGKIRGLGGLTMQGVTLGTLEYMSPEQCQGKQLDHRSDLYALGVVLFQMLSGRVPVPGGNPVMVMRKIVYDPLPSILEFCPGLPKPIVDILNRALAKNREARFSTGREFGESLRRALNSLSDAPAQAAPITPKAAPPPPPPDDEEPDDDGDLPTSMLPLSVARPVGPPAPPRPAAPPPPPARPPARPATPRPPAPPPPKPSPYDDEDPFRDTPAITDREAFEAFERKMQKETGGKAERTPAEEGAGKWVRLLLLLTALGLCVAALVYSLQLLKESDGDGAPTPPPVKTASPTPKAPQASLSPTPAPTPEPVDPSAAPGVAWTQGPKAGSVVSEGQVQLAWKVVGPKAPKSFILRFNGKRFELKQLNYQLNLKTPGTQTVELQPVWDSGERGDSVTLSFEFRPRGDSGGGRPAGGGPGGARPTRQR